MTDRMSIELLITNYQILLLMKFLRTHFFVVLILLFTANIMHAQCGPGEDSTPPELTCPAAVTGLTCNDELPAGFNSVEAYNNAFGPNMVSDNCEMDTIFYSDDVDPSTFSLCSTEGPFVVTRTYTAVDTAGNVSTCSYTLTYEADQNPPVISNPGNVGAGQLLTCTDSKDPYDLHLNNNRGLPSIVDDCKGSFDADFFASLPEVQDGWEVGEIITVNDMQVMYSQDVIEHPGGVCTDPNQRKYRIRRTWSVIDNCSNTTSVLQRINVVDNEVAPNIGITADELTYYFDDACSTTVLASEIEDGSTDNCENDPLSPLDPFDVSATALIRLAGTEDEFVSELTLDPSNSNFSAGCPINISLEVQVEDACANTAVGTKMITLRDTMSPVINQIPEDQEFDGCDYEGELGGEVTLAYSTVEVNITEDFNNFGGLASDACGIKTITYIDVLNQPDCPGPIYTIDRTYTVTDSCDNTVTGVQVFTFNDAEAPTFECPTGPFETNTSEDGEGDCLGSFEDLAVLNVTDDCSTPVTITYEVTGATTASGEGDASDIQFEVGVSTITYIATDCGGNTDECSFDVTVIDDEKPQITCNDDITLATDEGICQATLKYEIAAEDNCDATGESLTFNLLNGPDSLELADVGSYEVEWEVVDAQDLRDTCTFNITVEDQEAPVITCPENEIVQMDTLMCTRVYEYELPTATDNCTAEEDMTITLIDGLESGEEFPIGVTTITYEAEDEAGNRDTCSFEIEMLEFQNTGTACKSDLNFSLDENCGGGLTVSMVLEGTQYGCLDSCDISVYDEAGIEIPNSFSKDDLGKTYTYKVCCGGTCCEGNVTIEDKFTPIVACRDTALTCAEYLEYPLPFIEDNCEEEDPILVTQSIEDVSCTDPLYDRIINRYYYAKDTYGNVSDTCLHTIRIKKFDIEEVQAPKPGIFNIECGSGYQTDSNGDPVIDYKEFGEPFLGNRGLFTDQFMECNVMVTYDDEINQVAGITNVIRKWKVSVWSCAGDQEKEFLQFFQIKDTTGPEIQSCLEDRQVTTNSMSCSATVNLEPIVATDLCNEVKQVDISYNGKYISNSNGATVELPKGTTEVTYKVIDTYGNSSECSFNVTVADGIEPVALALANTVVSLDKDGNAEVFAKSFDNGSFDECSEIAYYVKRMDNGNSCDPVDNYPPNGNDNAQFNEAVDFCCADLGKTIMIQFRVCDDADDNGVFGGANDKCANVMVEATVEDNIPPVMVADLPDITVSCEYPIDYNNLTVFGEIVRDVQDRDSIKLSAEYVNFSSAPLDALIVDNCGNLISDELDTLGSLTACGTGTLLRRLTYGDTNGANTIVTQKIDVVNVSPFTENDIQWPSNYFSTTGANNCGMEKLLPDNLPVQFAEPIITEDNCDMVAINMTEEIIDFTEGSNACIEVQRTWTISDWCQQEGGVYKEFQHTQILRLTNLTPPEINGDCSNRLFESLDPECGLVSVTLSNSASDDCTDSELLKWTYTVDIDNDGSQDLFGNKNTLSNDFKIGTHRVTWTVNDGCGNSDECSYLFEVKNNKKPVAIAHNDLAYELGPVDSDGDGEPDFERIVINAEAFNKESYHICEYDVQVSFSEDVNDVTREYTCDDIGEQPINLYVTDENGNFSFVTTTVQIQNNIVEGCSQNIAFDISGNVKTEMEEMISDVYIKLEGGETSIHTNDEGEYAFDNLSKGKNYQVNPSFEDEITNGVSTLDIIMIQKHILGLEDLNSPLKLIAADANNSGSVSGSDIVLLRKMLLGLVEEIPNNTSWRFVDASHQWVDESNPWTSEFPEVYNIYELGGDMLIDFYGVKVGDVNYTASTNGMKQTNITTRSDKDLQLEIEPVSVTKNAQVKLPVYANSYNNIYGFQFELDFTEDQLEVVDISNGVLDLTDSYSFINESIVRISFNTNEAISVSNDEPLFYITLNATETIKSKQVGEIKQNALASESYDSALNTFGVHWNTRPVSVSSKDEFTPEMSVKQNSPNPWTNQSVIEIVSPKKTTGKLRVMNSTGQVLYLESIRLNSGYNAVLLSDQKIKQSGVMYYEVTVGEKTIMKKMVRLN